MAPAIAAAFAAILFATLKYFVLERKDPFKWAMKVIPVYLAITGAILALFIVVEAPTAPSLEKFGAGKAIGIILGVFFGVLLIAYTFFVPYFHRRLVRNDSRVKFYHLPLGPLLWKEDPWLYFPAKSGTVVIDYYIRSYDDQPRDRKNPRESTREQLQEDSDLSSIEKGSQTNIGPVKRSDPEERYLGPTAHLRLVHPARLLSWTKYILLQGVTRECVSFELGSLKSTHDRAAKYDLRVEHLWTYAQVASAMLMSIAHGNDAL